MKSWIYDIGRLENRLRPKLIASRNKYIKDFSENYPDDKSFIYADYENNLRKILYNHYELTIKVFSGKVAKNLTKKSYTYYSRLLEWASTEALSKSKLIGDTARSDVQNIISQGLSEGLGSNIITSNIRKLTGLSGFRAATIARTETNTAATYATVETANEIEKELEIVLVKEWLPTNDNRTRESHRLMRGNVILLNEKFEVDGDLMDRPSDPSASAENVINCRCGIAIYAKEN
jgi:SPP1 gp7 family putative phage head morphogenesis protein